MEERRSLILMSEEENPVLRLWGVQGDLDVFVCGFGGSRASGGPNGATRNAISAKAPVKLGHDNPPNLTPIPDS